MSSWNDYQPEESVRAQKGKYRVEIVDAEEAISKSSSLPMFVITVKPNPTNIKVKTYLVKNDKFNANATKFFDAFSITFCINLFWIKFWMYGRLLNILRLIVI